MKKSRKFLIASLVIAIAIATLIYVGINESGVYYMTVAELKKSGSTTIGQGLRISGNVTKGSVEEIAKDLILKFRVKDEEGPDNVFVNVYYKGIKPDSFKEDVQVILEGKYDPPKNLFTATTLLVKCPSRYEGETPPEDHDYSYKKKKLEVNTSAN